MQCYHKLSFAVLFSKAWGRMDMNATSKNSPFSLRRNTHRLQVVSLSRLCLDLFYQGR